MPYTDFVFTEDRTQPSAGSPPDYCLLSTVYTLLVVSLVIGCRPTNQVRKYEVAKEQPAPPIATEAQSGPIRGAKNKPTAASDRMLAAMVTRGDKVWFFKILGSKAQVAPTAAAFNSLIRSIQFDETGEPTWQLPEGWKQLPASGMRFATLQPDPPDPKLEVTVIPLPGPQPELANVNRWRQQLQLEPLSESDWSKQAKSFELKGGTAVLVDLEGVADASRMMPPFLAQGTPPAVPPGAQTPPASAIGTTAPAGSEDTELSFTLPKDWIPSAPGPMRRHLFVFTSGSQSVEISISTLGVQGAGLLPNVNRWRGQIGLAPIDETGLADCVSERQVGGASAQIVELTGSANDGDARSILGAIVIRDDKAWFFKMMGNSAMVRKVEPRFDAFLDSVTFKQ